MFWIIVAVVAVVGSALAWWLSGRARPMGADQESHVRKTKTQGDVGSATYRQAGDQQRFNRP